MPRISHYFFKTATIFLIVGIAMGLHMGLSEDHSAMPAHAHVLLLGWVTSALFGGYYALQPAKAERRIAFVHFGIYLFGMVIMLPALYLKYTGYQKLEPLLGGGSMIVGLGVLIFAYVLFSPDEARTSR
jgi:peptidoglycan/LPS O-acetylase OafA/YrhL